MISVAVVDDQTLVRVGLRVLLESEDDMAFAGEAADGRAALELLRRVHPDVVLMDVRMPVMEYVFDALRAGASGFLIKDTEPAELLHAIRVVASGESLLSPTVTRRVIREFAARPKWGGGAVRPGVRLLTDREREVVALVAEGLTNDEIGERLVMSPATARTHVSRAMVKLGARDRAQLVVFASQSGLTISEPG